MPDIIKISGANPDKKVIQKAAKIIRRGGLAAFPTETVYGIAALPKFSKKLDKVKKRPKGKPYSLHIAYKKDLLKYIKSLNKTAGELIKKYWPGPLTVILKTKSGRKLGFRMPDNKIALALIKAVGCPVIAPSANISGYKSPVSAEEITVSEGLDLILDGGRTKYGQDSTIVDLSGEIPKVIREGCLKIKGFKMLK